MSLYMKKNPQELVPYYSGMDLTGVSISETDQLNGSPKLGDMIATNPQDETDRWLVSEQFFKANYIPFNVEWRDHICTMEK